MEQNKVGKSIKNTLAMAIISNNYKPPQLARTKQLRLFCFCPKF